jgi:Ser-tRNA(Ala) deacylase AlaX
MKLKSGKQYHPQMHSAEHILNQTMVRMFNCRRSFSNHIEKKKSKCDYHFDRDLSPDEIMKIENKVNEVISEDLLVTEEFYSREKAETKFNLSKLPDDAGDKIRVIKIGDYDCCPCSGLHVSHTKEIGKFKIGSTDFKEGVLRIRFKLIEI